MSAASGTTGTAELKTGALGTFTMSVAPGLPPLSCGGFPCEGAGGTRPVAFVGDEKEKTDDIRNRRICTCGG